MSRFVLEGDVRQEAFDSCRSSSARRWATAATSSSTFSGDGGSLVKRLALPLVALVFLFPAVAAAASSGGVTTYATVIPSGDLSGRWTMRVTDAGRYTISFRGVAGVTGKLTDLGNRKVRFRDDPGPNACDSPGVYRFTLRGRTLTFRTIRDACRSRKGILTTAPWKEQ